MAISFSRPDPSSPASVRDANFPTSRRGFDQQEVRDFLRMVAAELARMQERERYLDQELRAMRLHRPAPPPELDDETLARMLGEETTRILQAARESAAAIRTKAEEAADRLLREARDDAQHLREDAESESSRRKRDAEQDAEAELEMAKQQGREMVEEARAYRERVLSELSRRRDLARQQIDQLVHGRDRLVQAFERSRLVAADVVAELAPLGELSEYVNLSPTTGPVPVMVPASRLGDISSISDDVLAARASSDPDDPALDPNGSGRSSDATTAIDARLGTGPRPTTSSEVTPPATLQPEPDATAPAGPVATSTPTSGATVLQFPDRRAESVVIAPGSEAEDDAVDDDEEDDAGGLADVVDRVHTDDSAGPNGPVAVADTADDADTDAVDTGAVDTDTEVSSGLVADEVDDDDITAKDVDDLFARLRSGAVESAATAADSDAADTADSDTAETADTAAPTPFELRDEALTPLIVSSGRKLKRVLADEQNDVLDRSRGKLAVRSVDDVLPPVDDHTARYFDAFVDDLRTAAGAGAASLSTSAEGAAAPAIADDVLSSIRKSLASDLVQPLRDRLSAGIAAVDGDNEDLAKKARAIYREWKMKRIDDELDDLLRHAYGRGALVAVEGQQVRWMFDPSVGACSDCEDNSLQGAITAGTAFPTGHVCAPAHAGCRCLVLPTA